MWHFESRYRCTKIKPIDYAKSRLNESLKLLEQMGDARKATQLRETIKALH